MTSPLPANDQPINLTENAISRVKQYLAKDAASESRYFRVSVEGGGCSGYQYSYLMDQKRVDDISFNFGDLELVVDPQSLEYIKGSTLDFVDDFQGTGFTFKNPNAKGTCGCGVSFTV